MEEEGTARYVLILSIDNPAHETCCADKQQLPGILIGGRFAGVSLLVYILDRRGAEYSHNA